MKLLYTLIFAFLFYSCGGGLNTRDLEAKANINKSELTHVANEFLKDKEIKYLIIASDYDSTRCQSINGWFNCPKSGQKWETWSDSLQTNIYLNSRLEVLKHEHIDTRTFNLFRTFLRSQELTKISRCYHFACEDCVEFESYTNGLRFDKVQPNELKEDYEYLHVKRIDKNWFVYTRDWN